MLLQSKMLFVGRYSSMYRLDNTRVACGTCTKRRMLLPALHACESQLSFLDFIQTNPKSGGKFKTIQYEFLCNVSLKGGSLRKMPMNKKNDHFSLHRRARPSHNQLTSLRGEYLWGFQESRTNKLDLFEPPIYDQGGGLWCVNE
jgi:hypothetical protein